MERRLPTLLLLGAAMAYFADMFLPWTHSTGFVPRLNGWTSIPAWLGAALSLGLVTWQLFRVAGIPFGSRAVEHVGAALLGTTTGFLAGSGVAYLRFGAVGATGRTSFAYGAWIAVVLAALLIAASFLELKEYDRELPARLRQVRILPPVNSGSAE